MGSVRWTRGAICALALSICVPAALADRTDRAPRKSLASCTTFAQQDQGDDKVELTIRNTCSVPVDCSITWRVVCAPQSKKRRAAHPGAAQLALPSGGAQSAEASAAICGDDSWAIDSIAWSCQVSHD